MRVRRLCGDHDSIDGCCLIKPEDLFWRPSNLMKIPNAFEAAEKDGRTADIQKELEDLFTGQKQSPTRDATSIPATCLRVTVEA